MKISNHNSAFDSTARATPTLGVPRGIARLMPRGMNYQPKLTDEGLLYVPIGFDGDDPPEPDVPQWVKDALQPSGSHSRELAD